MYIQMHTAFIQFLINNTLYITFESIEKPRPEHTKKPCCNLGGFFSCTVKLFPACTLFLRQTRQVEVCRKKSPRSELLVVRA